MTEELNSGNSESGGTHPVAPTPKPRQRYWRRLIRYELHQIRQRRERREMAKAAKNPEEKSARLTAVATAWIAGFTVVLALVGILTLMEVVNGGADTKTLVDASKKQAEAAGKSAEAAGKGAQAADKSAQAARDFADTAGHINAGIGDAVAKLNLQATELKESARQTARLATETAKANSQFLEAKRPWVGLNGQITITEVADRPGKQIAYTLNLKNFGGSPAFDVIPLVDVTTGYRNIEVQPANNKDCENLKFAISSNQWGSTVFPGGESNKLQTGSVDRIPPDYPKQIEAPMYFFQGCVAYQSSDGKVHHSDVCQLIPARDLKVGATSRSCARKQDAD